MREMTRTDDRVRQYLLDAGERPRVLYEYYVTGGGQFPLDMLRYDRCWPAGGEDAAKLDWTGQPGFRSVKMQSHREPTIDRWSSFQWSVGEKAVVP